MGDTALISSALSDSTKTMDYVIQPIQKGLPTLTVKGSKKESKNEEEEKVNVDEAEEDDIVQMFSNRKRKREEEHVEAKRRKVESVDQNC